MPEVVLKELKIEKVKQRIKEVKRRIQEQIKIGTT